MSGIDALPPLREVIADPAPWRSRAVRAARDRRFTVAHMVSETMATYRAWAGPGSG